MRRDCVESGRARGYPDLHAVISAGERAPPLGAGDTCIAYVALATTFFLHLRSFYHSHTASPRSSRSATSSRRAVSRARGCAHLQCGRAGYDGQFYAQIAVAGNPFDPALVTALDSVAYRNRRVLVPALAHVMGWAGPRSC
jgi:hypothetical protein